LANEDQLVIRSLQASITFTAESRKAKVCAEERILDTAPTRYGDELLVLARFVTETIGGRVIWDPRARIAYLFSPSRDKSGAG